MIKTADWIVDLSPKGGGGGGTIAAAGMPEDDVKGERSFTWQYLKPLLDGNRRRRKKCSWRWPTWHFGNTLRPQISLKLFRD
ncbi:MAG: hypothetical protein J0H04_01415 [Hyphomicrobium denitrificans]|nr:hypothetical protein [Hyphomicrobium denitrificans]